MLGRHNSVSREGLAVDRDVLVEVGTLVRSRSVAVLRRRAAWGYCV